MAFIYWICFLITRFHVCQTAFWLCSLCNFVESMDARKHCLYQLGMTNPALSNLTRINEKKPYELYEALCGKLLKRCQ